MASDDVTRLLAAARAGDERALDELYPLVYQDLHGVAHRALLGGRPGNTLNTTALLHEAYLKLHVSSSFAPQDRRHFFAVAARAMRQIIVDHARSRAAQKRGGTFHRVDLDAATIAADDSGASLLALEDALRKLAALDGRLAHVVELRFFGGLTVEETAEVLDVDPRTVKRDWRKARAMLYLTLEGRAAP
ncbi:MAG TPA: sigma-70 family RNA polymerase sigma factor [Candidatus Eisenbacteria bacterium]